MPFRTARLFALGGLAALALGGSAAAQAAHDGDYAGLLEVPGGPKLHLVLHLQTKGAETSAVLDSPDQDFTVGASAYKVENGEVNILFLPIMGELKGRFSDDGQTFKGVWNQGHALPLTLTRSAAAPAPAPAKP